MDKTKIYRIIALEIIILISVIVAIGTIWCIFLSRNYYYETKQSSLAYKIAKVSQRIDTLGSDKIRELYDVLKNDFIITFQVGEVEYAIPYNLTRDFQNDFPLAKKLAINSIGYSHIKKSDTNSAVVFDYVEYSKFLELMNRIDYRNKFYMGFLENKNLNNDYIRHIFSILKLNIEGFTKTEKEFLQALSDTDYVSRVYLAIRDIGISDFPKSQADFSSKIGVTRFHSFREFESFYKNSMSENLVRNKLFAENKSLNGSLTHAVKKKLENSEIKKIIFRVGLIMLLLLYPLRLSFYGIKWSFKTLLTKDQ